MRPLTNHMEQAMQKATRRLPDSKLIQFGVRANKLEAQLDELAKGARDLDDTPGYPEASEAYANLLGQMLAMPAHTVQGLRAKAERVLYWRKDYPVGMRVDPDISVAVSIASDLVAMKID